MFSEILESSTGRSVIGMSLLFAWVYISDYFEVIPFVAMTVQVLVRFIFFQRRRRALLSETIIKQQGTLGVYIWAKMGTSTLFKSKEIEKGSDAPDIKGLESLDGSSLSSLQSDVIYVVVFWATWCSRSRANLPTLNSYFKRYHNKADNVDFVGITAEPLFDRTCVRSRSARMFNQLTLKCMNSTTGTSFSVQKRSSHEFSLRFGSNWTCCESVQCFFHTQGLCDS